VVEFGSGDDLGCGGAGVRMMAIRMRLERERIYPTQHAIYRVSRGEAATEKGLVAVWVEAERGLGVEAYLTPLQALAMGKELIAAAKDAIAEVPGRYPGRMA
jgi:hypothetical protein